MLDGLARWRAQLMGRKAVRRLYPVLARRYGRAERYTAGQIERALEITGLGRRYRPYAHAVFADGAEIRKLEAPLQQAVEPLRAPHGMAAALQLYALSFMASGQFGSAGQDTGGGSSEFDGGGGAGGGMAGGDGGGAP